MPQFKLVKKEFNEIHQEWQLTYSCLVEFQFNRKKIIALTITDHYRVNHPEITNDLILELLGNLNGESMWPRKKHDKRDIYVWEWTSDENKEYRLIFWFKDNTANHLWIRNCYPIN